MNEKPLLLYFSYTLPFPPRDGASQRTFAQLLALEEVYSVDFVFLYLYKKEDMELQSRQFKDVNFRQLQMHQYNKWFKRFQFSYVPTPSIRKLIDSILSEKSYDKVFCRYVDSAKNLPKIDNLIIDIDDDFYELRKGMLSIPNSFKQKIKTVFRLTVDSFFYSINLNKS